MLRITRIRKSLSQSPTDKDFYSVLKIRVQEYFRAGNISPYGGQQIIIKTIIFVLIILVSYGVLLSGHLSGWGMVMLACVMGVGFAGVTMTTLHDANHGAYSSNNKINKAISFISHIFFVGGNAVSWRMQHNILHHRYTNIHGKDEDIEPYGFMRITPCAKHYFIYRYQHIYCFILYGFLTLVWVLPKEFFQLIRYRNLGLISSNARLYKEITILVIAKIIYFGYILFIPMLVLNISFWQWLAVFVCLHFVLGLIVSIVFQMAHVVSETSFVEQPTPATPIVELGQKSNQWAIHQMQTTANFAPRSKVMYWMIGGLNYQIEHHLFPGISHIHYPKLAAIVQKTAKEFDIPYYSHDSFFAALKSHIRLVKFLGQGA